jgi:hypothetical protein
MFEGMPDLQFKFFTLDAELQHARNFYVRESQDGAPITGDRPSRYPYRPAQETVINRSNELSSLFLDTLQLG